MPEFLIEEDKSPCCGVKETWGRELVEVSSLYHSPIIVKIEVHWCPECKKVLSVSEY